MTKPAAAIRAQDLKKAVTYGEGLNDNSNVIGWFWLVVGKPEFPVNALLFKLTGSAESPLAGFNKGNPLFKIALNSKGGFQINFKKRIFYIPAKATYAQIKLVLWKVVNDV